MGFGFIVIDSDATSTLAAHTAESGDTIAITRCLAASISLTQGCRCKQSRCRVQPNVDVMHAFTCKRSPLLKMNVQSK